jgi:hypothetical protein
VAKSTGILAKEEDLLVGVARSIGSTLGTVVSKVNSVTKAAKPATRLRARKVVCKRETTSASRPSRRKRSKKRS